ncbi:MAG: hypothetical protein RMJ37_07950 [Spirochaetia bacterium]|nr:hypothetical protein [Spirochaetota bacterium]MCX8095962.1 hypothetical protein [Spirochaetota bacterium]MDW8113246.1 hypothetical protein [Spirochaetia bacterium]
MIKNLVYDAINYFTSPSEVTTRVLNDDIDIERLGIVGLVLTFFSVVVSARIDVGFWIGFTFVVLAFTYAIFVIGFLMAIGRKPSIDVPKVFWFFFSVGIIDALVIAFLPLSALVGWLGSLLSVVALGLKIYYLMIGVSKIFNISRSFAFIVLFSPYVVILVVLVLLLISSYTTISGALESMIEF